MKSTNYGGLACPSTADYVGLCMNYYSMNNEQTICLYTIFHTQYHYLMDIANDGFYCLRMVNVWLTGCLWLSYWPASPSPPSELLQMLDQEERRLLQLADDSWHLAYSAEHFWARTGVSDTRADQQGGRVMVADELNDVCWSLRKPRVLFLKGTVFLACEICLTWKNLPFLILGP